MQRLQLDIFIERCQSGFYTQAYGFIHLKISFIFIVKLLLKKTGFSKHSFDIGFRPLSFFLGDYFRLFIRERCLGNLQTQDINRSQRQSRVDLIRAFSSRRSVSDLLNESKETWQNDSF